jgi:hypothetical protein
MSTSLRMNVTCHVTWRACRVTAGLPTRRQCTNPTARTTPLTHPILQRNSHYKVGLRNIPHLFMNDRNRYYSAHQNDSLPASISVLEPLIGLDRQHSQQSSFPERDVDMDGHHLFHRVYQGDGLPAASPEPVELIDLTTIIAQRDIDSKSPDPSKPPTTNPPVSRWLAAS